MKEDASKARRSALHDRWATALTENLPIGVPAEVTRTAVGERPWPATFGDMIDGKPVHRADQGQGYCFQCLHCRYYLPLDGRLGADWGACSSAASQYDRQVVFEHWTCPEYEESGT